MLFIAVALAATPIALYVAWKILYANNHKTVVPVVVYHSVRPKKGIIPTSVETSVFRNQLEWLHENQYHSIDADTLLKIENDRQQQEANQVFIGFEDSYSIIAETALPLLKSYGFTATLFVITDYIGKKNYWDVSCSNVDHMDKQAIAEAIKSGFSIASHTKTHTDLRALSDVELRNELEGSRLALEEMFGVPVKALSYPFGRYNERIKLAARDSGYDMAFTINRPSRQHSFDPYAIPSTGIYSVDKLHNFESKILRNSSFWMDAMRDKMFNRFACGTILVKSGKRKKTT